MRLCWRGHPASFLNSKQTPNKVPIIAIDVCVCVCVRAYTRFPRHSGWDDDDVGILQSPIQLLRTKVASYLRGEERGARLTHLTDTIYGRDGAGLYKYSIACDCWVIPVGRSQCGWDQQPHQGSQRYRKGPAGRSVDSAWAAETWAAQSPLQLQGPPPWHDAAEKSDEELYVCVEYSTGAVLLLCVSPVQKLRSFVQPWDRRREYVQRVFWTALCAETLRYVIHGCGPWPALWRSTTWYSRVGMTTEMQTPKALH